MFQAARTSEILIAAFEKQFRIMTGNYNPITIPERLCTMYI